MKTLNPYKRHRSTLICPHVFAALSFGYYDALNVLITSMASLMFSFYSPVFYPLTSVSLKSCVAMESLTFTSVHLLII